MIRDLAGTRRADELLDADVLVVGAGTAGLLLATRVAAAGRRVIVLESGGEQQSAETHPLNEVVHRRSVYSGAASGRFRCLGGTSSRWGGAMLPFLASDCQVGQWPVPYAELLAYAPQIERLFALPPSRYEAPELARRDDGDLPSHVARFASFPAFRHRNVATLLDSELRNGAGPDVWLNATATGFDLAPDGRLVCVRAQAPDGSELRVRATETVIAAGAIESTRLLLLADRQHGGRLFAPEGVLGRYFHDHLSVKVGSIVPSSRTALNRVVGFQFDRGGMRNLRFEPNESPAIRAQIPPGFAHIAFQSAEGSGFDALRDFFRCVQQRRLPDARVIGRLISAAPWLVRVAWWRFFEHRLLYPGDAEIELHMVIQQEPTPDNRIGLAAQGTDVFGQPLAEIDWAVSKADERALTRSTDLFCEFWSASPLARLGTIRRRASPEAEAELALGGGVYHPAGSVRMGLSPVDGVVDRDFRVFRVPNVRVISTATFPNVGGANPTMTLLMAALRTADQLIGR